MQQGPPVATGIKPQPPPTQSQRKAEVASIQLSPKGDITLQVKVGASVKASCTLTSIKNVRVRFGGRFQARFATDGDFFNEKQETKRASFVCPHCRERSDYDVRWLTRTKKQAPPRVAKPCSWTTRLPRAGSM